MTMMLLASNINSNLRDTPYLQIAYVIMFEEFKSI